MFIGSQSTVSSENQKSNFVQEQLIFGIKVFHFQNGLELLADNFFEFGVFISAYFFQPKHFFIADFFIFRADSIVCNIFLSKKFKDFLQIWIIISSFVGWKGKIFKLSPNRSSQCSRLVWLKDY